MLKRNYITKDVMMKTDLVLYKLAGYIQLFAEFTRQRDVCSAHCHSFSHPHL